MQSQIKSYFYLPITALLFVLLLLAGCAQPSNVAPTATMGAEPTATTDAGMATPESSDVVTDTTDMGDTDAMTDTMDMTDTMGMSDTVGITDTLEITDTETVTGN
ncbi:MAG: hypothetical protein KDE54_04310 [Caldilineaceae bacterium]|nr:hypothetical protein [Caldilineaceae bacterium]MCB0096003.1 hypothetical protein [Caldilineaceae bacterium]MCB0140906.1 hypothetical protein [Caldilineaceae bacterium]